jgi:hypothetical protein
MYFLDLSDYGYNLPKSIPGVRNVGWLDRNHEFDKGAVPTEVCRKLLHLIRVAKANQMRGIHECDFCANRDRISVTDAVGVIWLGAAEIWVPGGGGLIYAAPDMVYHYINAHGYRPPREFIDAVDAYSEELCWNANDEYDRRVAALY